MRSSEYWYKDVFDEKVFPETHKSHWCEFFNRIQNDAFMSSYYVGSPANRDNIKVSILNDIEIARESVNEIFRAYNTTGNMKTSYDKVEKIVLELIKKRNSYHETLLSTMYESLMEIINYRGGAESSLDDEYVVDRAKSVLVEYEKRFHTYMYEDENEQK